MKPTITIPEFAKLNKLRENLLREFITFSGLSPAYAIGRVRAFYLEDLEHILDELTALKSSLQS